MIQTTTVILWRDSEQQSRGKRLIQYIYNTTYLQASCSSAKPKKSTVFFFTNLDLFLLLLLPRVLRLNSFVLFVENSYTYIHIQYTHKNFKTLKKKTCFKLYGRQGA